MIFGLICLFGNIVFILFVMLNLQRFKKVSYFSRDLIRLSWGFFIYLTKIFGFLEVNLNIDKLNLNEKTLIIANHPSLLDVVFMLSHLKRINCVVKDSLRKNIFLFLAIKAANYIPNTNNEELLNKSLSVLHNGENLLIFPEGSRTKDNLNFHKSAFYIGIKEAIKIYCIYIDMSPRSLKKDQPWYQTPSQKIKYSFKLIKTIDINSFMPASPDPIRVRNLHKTLSQLYKKEMQWMI